MSYTICTFEDCGNLAHCNDCGSCWEHSSYNAKCQTDEQIAESLKLWRALPVTTGPCAFEYCENISVVGYQTCQDHNHGLKSGPRTLGEQYTWGMRTEVLEGPGVFSKPYYLNQTSVRVTKKPYAAYSDKFNER